MSWGRIGTKQTWPNPDLVGPAILVGAGGGTVTSVDKGYTNEASPGTAASQSSVISYYASGAKKYGYYRLASAVSGAKIRAACFSGQDIATPRASLTGSKGSETEWSCFYLLDLVVEPFDLATLTWTNQGSLDVETVTNNLLEIQNVSYNMSSPLYVDIGLAGVNQGGASAPNSGLVIDSTSAVYTGPVYGFRIRPYKSTDDTTVTTLTLPTKCRVMTY